MTHTLARTNKKGLPFRGRCIKCGAQKLTISEGNAPCPNDELQSDASALFQILQEAAEARTALLAERDDAVARAEAAERAARAASASAMNDCVSVLIDRDGWMQRAEAAETERDRAVLLLRQLDDEIEEVSVLGIAPRLQSEVRTFLDEMSK